MKSRSSPLATPTPSPIKQVARGKVLKTMKLMKSQLSQRITISSKNREVRLIKKSSIESDFCERELFISYTIQSNRLSLIILRTLVRKSALI